MLSISTIVKTSNTHTDIMLFLKFDHTRLWQHSWAEFFHGCTFLYYLVLRYYESHFYSTFKPKIPFFSLVNAHRHSLWSFWNSFLFMPMHVILFVTFMSKLYGRHWVIYCHAICPPPLYYSIQSNALISKLRGTPNLFRYKPFSLYSYIGSLSVILVYYIP